MAVSTGWRNDTRPAESTSATDGSLLLKTVRRVNLRALFSADPARTVRSCQLSGLVMAEDRGMGLVQGRPGDGDPSRLAAGLDNDSPRPVLPRRHEAGRLDGGQVGGLAGELDEGRQVADGVVAVAAGDDELLAGARS